nr:L,D-transpeptidase family protein [uncultured Lacibacter sp.]
MLKKSLLFVLSIGLVFTGVFAQSHYEGSSATVSAARTFKGANLFSKVEDSLRKELKEKGFQWPLKYMYVRAFKHEKQLEVWLKNDWAEKFELFKVYKVCATSGTYGPKRKEGDKQIPEGFYYINEFKPNSNYHLALGLNYPNASDAILSDHNKPGGDIYIHGNCVTIGCLPLTDSLIEQVYYLASIVKDQGQDFIPVHIYPLRYDSEKAMQQLVSKTKHKQGVQEFATQIQEAYEFFEDTHQLPAVMISKNGNYVVAGNPDIPKVKRLKVIETNDKVNPYAAWALEEKVDRVPFHKDGNAALQKWLFNLSQSLVPMLNGNTSMSLQVEFIVDKNGNTALATVIRGGYTELNKVVKEKFEKELKWQPALKDGEAVNTKLVQNLNIVAPEDLD